MMKYLSDINWWKQFALNVGGVLTSILGFLSILNIQFHWLTVGLINEVVTVIIAFGTLFVGSLATSSTNGAIFWNNIFKESRYG